jgi:hypothetical protein
MMGGMTAKIDPSRTSFAIGFVLCVLGKLMLCYCPWMFAMAAVAFGVAAATANKQLVRWLSVACIALAVAMAIGDATSKERARSNALEVIRRNDELNKSRASQPESSISN